MPFEVLETQTKANMPPQASISYLRHVRKDKEHLRGKIKPKLIVTLPTTICLTKRKKFAIHAGTGIDRGKFRICALADGTPGGVKGHDFKTHVVLRFGYVPAFGDEIFDNVKVPVVRIDDNTFEFKVDTDLFAAEEPSNVKKIA